MSSRPNVVPVKRAREEVFNEDIQTVVRQLYKIGGYPLGEQEDASFIAQLAIKRRSDNDKSISLRMSELSTWACYYVQQACLIVVASKMIKGVLDDYYATFGNESSVETRSAILIRVAEDARPGDALTKMASIFFAKLAAEFATSTSTKELRRINLISEALLGVKFNEMSWDWEPAVIGGDDRYREPQIARSVSLAKTPSLLNPFIYEGIVKSPAVLRDHPARTLGFLDQRYSDTNVGRQLRRPVVARQSLREIGKRVEAREPIKFTPAALTRRAARWIENTQPKPSSRRRWFSIPPPTTSPPIKHAYDVASYAAPRVLSKLAQWYDPRPPYHTLKRTLRAILPIWFIPKEAYGVPNEAYPLVLRDPDARSFALARAACDTQFFLQELLILRNILKPAIWGIVYVMSHALNEVSFHLLDLATVGASNAATPQSLVTRINEVHHWNVDEDFIVPANYYVENANQEYRTRAVLVVKAIMRYFVACRQFLRDVVHTV